MHSSMRLMKYFALPMDAGKGPHTSVWISYMREAVVVDYVYGAVTIFAFAQG